MGRPKNSTISRRSNISRTVTHKCHEIPDDRTPEEVKGNGKISEYIEEESIWTGDDESVEDAQQDVWSISSDSLLIAVLDHEEENDIHLSDELLHFSMILSKGAASWYQSVTDARASNKWPHQYRGDLRTSQWRALKVAKMNGQTIRHFFNPVVSMEIYIRMDHPADIPKAKKRVIDSDSILITPYSYSIQSGRFMNSYQAGLDGPQASWACKKY